MNELILKPFFIGTFFRSLSLYPCFLIICQAIYCCSHDKSPIDNHKLNILRNPTLSKIYVLALNIFGLADEK